MPEPLITPIREAAGERGRVPDAFRPTNERNIAALERVGRSLARSRGTTPGRITRGTPRPPARPNNRAGRRGGGFGGASRPGRSTGNAGARRLGGASNRGTSPSRGRGARDTLNRQSTGSGRDRRTGRG